MIKLYYIGAATFKPDKNLICCKQLKKSISLAYC